MLPNLQHGHPKADMKIGIWDGGNGILVII